jgi:hypothetical protein
MEHVIRVERMGERTARGRPQYRAAVMRSDGRCVWTESYFLSAEEAWEAAARYCAREDLTMAPGKP